MEKAAEILNNFRIPFEMECSFGARTPDEVEKFAKNAEARGIKVYYSCSRNGCASSGCYSRDDTSPCYRSAN